jgi:hypothetical protein
LAPDLQPFFVSSSVLDLPASADGEMTPESRDTFRTYDMDRDLKVVWLRERSFTALPKDTRARLVRSQVIHRRGAVPSVQKWKDLLDPGVLRLQADGHRFVWWPSLLIDDDGTILERVVSEGRRTSRHHEVRETTWRRCATVLPGARALAGTFPTGSGPNCFGTVMAACGESKAADVWMLPPPFETWLAEKTRPGGGDDSSGTVLVWRDSDGAAKHAAVTIGDGWGLEKPSQDWHSPRLVLPVRDLIMANRTRGLRVQRRKLKA